MPSPEVCHTDLHGRQFILSHAWLGCGKLLAQNKTGQKHCADIMRILCGTAASKQITLFRASYKCQKQKVAVSPVGAQLRSTNYRAALVVEIALYLHCGLNLSAVQQSCDTGILPGPRDM